MVETGYESRPRTPADDNGAARQVVGGAADAASTAVGATADTAKDQAGKVAGEVKSQARNLAATARDRVGSEAQTQNTRLVQGVREFVDELDRMVEGRTDSPARGVVTQVSQGGRRVADYLEEHGPDGVLREVQDFARRKPGTFLAVAAVAGFVAGRVGKGVLSAQRPDTDPAAVVPDPAPVGVGSSTTTYVNPTVSDPMLTPGVTAPFPETVDYPATRL